MKKLAFKSVKQGFTLVEIMVVILIIAILTGIAVPNWLSARTNSRTKSCIDNLKHIDTAKEQWAMDTKAQDGATVLMSDIYPSYLKSQPSCPAGGNYSVAVVGQPPTCDVVNHVMPS